MDKSPLGPMKGTLCGQCLRVTNKRTGHAEVVRIVDMCGNGGELAGYLVKLATSLWGRGWLAAGKHHRQPWPF